MQLINQSTVASEIFLSIVVFWVVTSCGNVGGYKRSNETLVTTYETTRRHTPEHHNRYFHRRETVKSQKYYMMLVYITLESA